MQSALYLSLISGHSVAQTQGCLASKAWALNVCFILPTGCMEANQAALRGAGARTHNGLVPGTAVHLPQRYSVSMPF